MLATIPDVENLCLFPQVLKTLWMEVMMLEYYDTWFTLWPVPLGDTVLENKEKQPTQHGSSKGGLL